jgi:hypothetical protein
MTMMDTGNRTENRSIFGLLRELRDEFATLLRQEVALAKTEVSEKADLAKRNVTYIAIGGVIALSGFLCLLAAASVGLAVGLREGGVSPETAAWLAPLLVGLVVAIVGYILLQKGISTLKRESLAPERTVQSIKEDTAWARQKIA